MMMSYLKVFGSICILSFVVLATVSAQNETASTSAAAVASTSAAAVATTTLAAVATTTTAAATTTTAAAATTGQPPTPTTAPPPRAPSQDFRATKISRIDAETRITSVNYDEVKCITSVKWKAFKTDFEGKMLGVMKQKNKLVIDVKVTGVRSGSVIVEYYLVLNTTSEAEALKIANAVTEAIKTGQIGNYTTDPTYTPDVYITRKVKASDVLAALNSKNTILIP